MGILRRCMAATGKCICYCLPSQRKKRKEKAAFNRGFALAAAELLRGRSPLEMKSYLKAARDFRNYNKFDSGYEQAIENFLTILRRQDAERR